MFECVFDIDPEAGEAALRALVEQFERLKSAAAAAQAHDMLVASSGLGGAELDEGLRKAVESGPGGTTVREERVN